jgi:hypothetical protein
MSLLLMLMFVFQDKWNYICYKVENWDWNFTLRWRIQ